jgi:hypothetical protein
MSVVAYLDAGSGSLIASVAAAGFAGAAVVARSSWHKAKGRLKLGQRGGEAGDAEAEAEAVTEADADAPEPSEAG